jgi:hypothetical protein
LREENSALRQQLTQAESENRKLRENADVVSRRLEALIERLPGDPT